MDIKYISIICLCWIKSSEFLFWYSWHSKSAMVIFLQQQRSFSMLILFFTVSSRRSTVWNERTQLTEHHVEAVFVPRRYLATRLLAYVHTNSYVGDNDPQLCGTRFYRRSSRWYSAARHRIITTPPPPLYRNVSLLWIDVIDVEPFVARALPALYHLLPVIKCGDKRHDFAATLVDENAASQRYWVTSRSTNDRPLWK